MSKVGWACSPLQAAGLNKREILGCAETAGKMPTPPVNLSMAYTHPNKFIRSP